MASFLSWNLVSMSLRHSRFCFDLLRENSLARRSASASSSCEKVGLSRAAAAAPPSCAATSGLRMKGSHGTMSSSTPL
eukprot:CAMPEP_0197493302 /NCGR_PEP_ID=MMETSP1311-20131121/21151_1 /TAXON_ID=464262 /ORGANISM="Genus nov. species nov., Strain RCC856" /LENGTH=77 /DNA_ID=CAMNT_0043038529 /DNA_START=163 /DNA_END=396 /DNA_ORIENTATION=-